MGNIRSSASISPAIFLEADWNDQAVKETLAERAAWDFHYKHKAEVAWDVVALNPLMVFGPIIHEVSSPHAQNTSSQTMYDVFTKEGSAVGSRSWVDVRDITLAHVLGCRRRRWAGRGSSSLRECFRSRICSTPPPSSKHLKGTPGAGKDAVGKA
ncbi:hypothetical protein R3P38DRAFT_3212309 [Favolaschia claudopus]|uniref:Uncharacterized protein n=1 Tax=Favolaschia claudopus TaxID=2862362 RepID=A0AAW0ADH7_9AGAR